MSEEGKNFQIWGLWKKYKWLWGGGTKRICCRWWRRWDFHSFRHISAIDFNWRRYAGTVWCTVRGTNTSNVAATIGHCCCCCCLLKGNSIGSNVVLGTYNSIFDAQFVGRRWKSQRPQGWKGFKRSKRTGQSVLRRQIAPKATRPWCFDVQDLSRRWRRLFPALFCPRHQNSTKLSAHKYQPGNSWTNWPDQQKQVQHLPRANSHCASFFL